MTGVGYFETSAISGVNQASMAGGAEVLFYAQGLAMEPSDNVPIFTQSQLNFQGLGPALSFDNQFQSMTASGMLEYTVPSFMQLHGLSYDQLYDLDWITYQTSVASYDETSQKTTILTCPTAQAANCFITLSRAYTPILYYLSPQVVFQGSEVAFWVDPRST